MKKFTKIICAVLCFAMALALCACSTNNSAQDKKTDEKADDDNTQIANPVRDSDAEEFKAAGITMPDIDGKTPVYTIIDGDELLYQADYGDFIIRVQKTDEQEDISGMNYNWKDDGISTLELLQGNPIIKTDGSGAGIVYWYLNGYSWSVGMSTGADVDTLKSLYIKTADVN